MVVESLSLEIRSEDSFNKVATGHGSHAFVDSELKLPSARLTGGVDAWKPKSGTVLMTIGEEVRSPLSQASLALWHYKMHTSLRLFKGEFNPNPEWLALSHQTLLVSLARYPDVQLATIEVGIHEVASSEVVFAEGVQVPLLNLCLTHFQSGVKILERRLHILIQAHLEIVRIKWAISMWGT